ncbi:MAG: phosphomannomutase/phosphoglucomutase [bacterium]|nr:phosphomannomutase/phosphoglucomutase [bacterium]
MQVNPKIFKAYDVRGIAGSEITSELSYAVGRGFAALFLKNPENRKAVVGQDARPTSAEFTKELIRGLRDGGADVIGIGLVTTPLFYFSVNASEAAGGIMVTASHNPAEYNGFKVVKEKAVAIGLDTGLGGLRDLVMKEEFGEPVPESSFSEANFLRQYLDSLTQGVHLKKFNIAIDAGNGMIGVVLPKFLGRLGIEAHSLYLEPDCTFPNHEANPLKEETLVDLKALMREHAVDFGVAFDGDGDRIGFVLSDGQVVLGDIMLAFLVKEYLALSPGSAVVYAVNCSHIVPETILSYGGKPIRSKIGHTLIKEKMKETGAILGGEMSTHYAYKELGGVESTMLTLIRVCQALTRSGKTLKEALRPFMKYAKTPEMNFSVNDKEAKLQELSGAYQDGKQDWLDGLTVEYDTWWFNARLSNTEPLLRLCVEANSKELLERKLEELKLLMRNKE